MSSQHYRLGITEMHLQAEANRTSLLYVSIYLNGEHVHRVKRCKCGLRNFQEDAARWLRRKNLIGPRTNQQSLTEYCKNNNITLTTALHQVHRRIK